MTDLLPAEMPPPHIDPGAATEPAPDLIVIPDGDVPLVPNVGVIGGRDAVLVVDTGIGPGNGERLLEFARERAAGRRIYLTTTHFHPEHAFGAEVFTRAGATWLVNRAQAEDLRDKGQGYLEMFRGFGPVVEAELAGVQLVEPDEVYDGTRVLDLGGRTVELRPTGRAHTRGDQVVVVPDAGAVFGGDLVEAGRFAIFPWFPPHDTDATGPGWIRVMEGLVAEEFRIVVPGHGAPGGPERLDVVLEHLRLLRDETWRRRDSAMPEEQIVAEVREVLSAAYPTWVGHEWIAAGVGCFCAEHTVRPEVTA
ncbi:MBL fold metallo-hydrolase [Pseudonocardia kongjuensis]